MRGEAAVGEVCFRPLVDRENIRPFMINACPVLIPHNATNMSHKATFYAVTSRSRNLCIRKGSNETVEIIAGINGVIFKEAEAHERCERVLRLIGRYAPDCGSRRFVECR